MTSPKDKTQIDEAFRKVISLLQSANEEDIPTLLGDGILDDFLKAIAKHKVPNQGTPYEYLLANKRRLQLLALLRVAITRNYSIAAKVNDIDVFVSPTEWQWFPEGVMFVQGQERFTGLLGYYEAGRVMFAIAAKDARPGELLGRDHFLFVDPEEAQRRSELAAIPRNESDLDEALQALDLLLTGPGSTEGEYQSYFVSHPWVFGAEYKQIDSHLTLDDRNIPDFTAVRVHDAARDIIEIKPASMPLFQRNNELRSDFNAAWNQAERYLDFARREKDYLYRQKGLFFDNPYCYLIAGYNLTRDQIDVIRLKERLNPAIKFRTYNDIHVMAKGTVEFIKQLRRQYVEQSPPA